MTHEKTSIVCDRNLDSDASLETALELLQNKVRATISVETLQSALDHELIDIEKKLEVSLKLLTLHAMKESDKHYEYRKQLDEQNDCRARFATVVTLKNQSVKCVWNFNGFQAGREEGAYFKALPKARGKRYSPKVFKEALPEERALIDDIEACYKSVCEAADMLKLIYKEIKRVQKHIAKMDKNPEV